MDEMADANESFGGTAGAQSAEGARESFSELQKLLGQLSEVIGRLGPTADVDIRPSPWKDPKGPQAELIPVGYKLDKIYGFVSNVRIAGVELTQSIQYFLMNKQGSGYRRDNSVPLIAHKDLILRVYPDQFMFGRPHPPTNRATGKVRFGNETVLPLNGPLWVKSASSIDRGKLNDTLNFRIPAQFCHGRVNFRISVYDPAGPENDRLNSDETIVGADFVEVPPLRVYGVLVHFTGNGLDLPAPTGVDLVITLARFVSMFPVVGFDYGVCTVIDRNDDLSKKAGWEALAKAVANIRDLAGTGGIYVGLVPANTVGLVPKSDGTRGIGNWGFAISQKDDTRALSHEFGHALGRDHVKSCGEGGDIDTTYPTYGSYAAGSIGEYGLDLRRMKVFDPTQSRDLMTYCDNPNVLDPPLSWISPHNYWRMMYPVMESGGTLGFGRPTAAIPYLVLNFRVYREGRVQVGPSYHVTGTIREGLRERRPVALDLLGADGEVIRTHHCHRFDPYQDPADAYLDFHELVPWDEGIARVVFVRDGQVLDTVDAQGEPPRVRLHPPRRVDHNGHALLRLEWEVPEHTGDLWYAVRYSHDGGESWLTLTADLTDTRFVANLDLLPGGERCVFQVVTSSGLLSSIVETEPVDVPRKQPTAHILAPTDGERFLRGETVTLMGAGFSPDFGVSELDAVLWASNRDGHLGVGHQVMVNRLQPGRHRITMTASGHGQGDVEASVWIFVDERPIDPCAEITSPTF